MKTLKELSDRSNFDIEFPLMESLYSMVDAISDTTLEESRQSEEARFKKFFNSNKELVKDASVVALSKYATWNKNTRKTLTLHAKDSHERRTIGTVVDALVKSKKFKIQKLKFHGGRKIWIMKKQ